MRKIRKDAQKESEELQQPRQIGEYQRVLKHIVYIDKVSS